MQVGGGGFTGVSDVADKISALHSLTFATNDPAHVCIERMVTVAVANGQVLAVSTSTVEFV